MKFKRTLTSLMFILFMSIGHLILAQPMTPSQFGEDGNQESGPIGSGIVILLTLAGAYGAKKVYDARKKIRE
jgi:hypothetical protein